MKSTLIFVNYVSQASSRNNERMKPYHRLDLSVEFFKKKKRYERTWVIGAYNAYSRANPFYLKMVQEYNADTQRVEYNLRQFSLFPIVPSIAWKFKF